MMDSEIRNYVAVQFNRYPDAQHNLPVAPFSSMALIKGERAKLLVNWVDESASKRFVEYREQCMKAMNAKVVSEPERKEMIKRFKTDGQLIGRRVGPAAGCALGFAGGAGALHAAEIGGAYLLGAPLNPSLVLAGAAALDGWEIGRTRDMRIKSVAALAMIFFLAKANPLLLAAEAGALLSLHTDWPARIGSEVGGWIGEIYGNIMTFFAPPKVPPDLTNWKIALCEVELTNLEEDLRNFRELIETNKSIIEAIDLEKLYSIANLIEERINLIKELKRGFVQ